MFGHRVQLIRVVSPTGWLVISDEVGYLLLFMHGSIIMGLDAAFSCCAGDQSIWASRQVSCAGVRPA